MADKPMRTDYDMEKVDTVTDGGMPVKERISSIEAARSVYEDFVGAYDDEFQRRARLRGQINGNPPYNPDRLDELGLGYMTNMNFLEMRAILDEKAATHYELFFEVPTLIQVRFRFPEDPRMPRMGYEEIIAEEFSKTLFDWSGFLVMMDHVRRDADAYGLGVAAWTDEFDWRPKSFNCSNFIPDASAEIDIDNLQIFNLKDKFYAGDLLRKIENEEYAKQAGWNISYCRELLKRVYIDEEEQTSSATGMSSNDAKYNLPTWEEFEQRVRNNDWEVQRKEFEPIRVVHQLIREVDTGEITHLIFAEGQMPETDNFMFKSPRRFKRMTHVLWWLPYNNGDGTYLRSVRGLASMLELHCDLSNRYLGRVFDAGFMASSLILHPNRVEDMDSLQLVRAGVVTVTPPGVQIQNSSFSPPFAHLVQLRSVSSEIMRNNTGIYRQHPELFAERQPEKTARQVVEEVSREARAEKSNIAYDYYHIERLYREVFRRITRRDYLTSELDLPGKQEAIDFVNRCITRGVPEQILFTPGAIEIYATRAIGMGSWGTKLDITQQVLNMRGLYDEAGQINALRDWLGVRVGYQNVDRYKSLINRDKLPHSEKSFAALENNDFAQGQACKVGSDQLHAIHFGEHAELVGPIVQGVMESGGAVQDPQQLLTILSVALPHMEEHIQYLAQDPARKPLVEQGIRFIKAAAKVAEFLQKAVQAQAQEQQAAQQEAMQQQIEQIRGQMSEEMQVAMNKIRADYEVERMKQASLNAMRQEKTDVQMDIRRQSAEHDMALKEQKQTSEIELERRKVEEELAIKRRQAGARE